MKYKLIGVIAFIAITMIACKDDSGGNSGNCTDHTWGTLTQSTNPTCTTAGEKTQTCTTANCGTVNQTTKEVVPALGHDWEYRPGSTPSTCTVKGSGDRDCDRCEIEELDVEFPLDPNAHDWKYVAGATIPTCTTPGSGNRTCELCLETSIGGTYPADGVSHVFDGSKWTQTRVATCTTPYEDTEKCAYDDCSELNIANKKTDRGTVATAHVFDGSKWIETTAPNCTAKGINTEKCAYETCGALNNVNTREGADVRGHNFPTSWTVVTPATCIEGLERRFCLHADCDDQAISGTQTQSTVLGHDNSGAAATCTTPKICAREYCTHVIDEGGHTFNWGLALTSQCTRSGCSHTATGAPPATWTAVIDSTFGANFILDITYANDMFVAVGGSGRMAWSQDGVTWTAVTNSTFGNIQINRITYGNGRFVAAGWNGRMAWSQDGVTWTAVSNSTFDTNRILGITYANDMFVAVGNSGRMAWSQDGVTWADITATDSTFANNINGITYGNDRFVAVGDSGRMAWSQDGVTWTAVTGGTGTGTNPTDPGNSTFGANRIDRITYGNSRFVATGVSGRMAWSQDGVTWTAVADSTFDTNVISGITYGNGRFVAVGQNGRMAWSQDGVTWTAVTGGTGTNPVDVPGNSTFGANQIQNITYSNGKFVAVGMIGRMAWHEVKPVEE